MTHHGAHASTRAFSQPIIVPIPAAVRDPYAAELLGPTGLTFALSVLKSRDELAALLPDAGIRHVGAVAGVDVFSGRTRSSD
jgi:hypothetical protein